MNSLAGILLVFEQADAVEVYQRLSKLRNNNYEIITKTCWENYVFSSRVFWYHDKFMGSGLFKGG